MKRLESTTMIVLIIMAGLSLFWAWLVGPIALFVGSILGLMISWLHTSIDCFIEEYKSLNKQEKRDDLGN